MSGYNGFSKSNNAVAAENSGLLVASALAREAARAWPRLRGLKAADIEAEVASSEWHHSSKMFNRVNYFDFESLRTRHVRARLYRRVLARRAAKARKPITLTGCTVEWLDWGGTRRRPTAEEMKAAACTVTFKPASDFVEVAAPAQYATRVNGLVNEYGACRFRKALTTRGFRVIDAAGVPIRTNPCG